MDLKNKKVVVWLSMSITLILVLSSQSFAATSTFVRAGYWIPDSDLPLSSINSTLFTHLFAAFADLDNSTNQVYISSSKADSFSQFTSVLSQTNPSITTLLSIGGGYEFTKSFESMIRSPTSRKAFIDSAIKTARSYSFHGLDLHYLFSSTSTRTMSYYGPLISEWRAAITEESISTQRSSLLLTAAVYYRTDYSGLYYPTSTLAAYLDFLNIVAYNFYTPTWPWLGKTKPYAALNDNSMYSGSNGVASWIGAGVPPTKLVFGVPFYGYAWKLIRPETENGYMAASSGPALTDDGSIDFKKINEYFAGRPGTGGSYDPTYVEAYRYAGDTWVTHDVQGAVSEKMNFVIENGLLGYFCWHVGADDNFKLATAAYDSFSGFKTPVLDQQIQSI